MSSVRTPPRPPHEGTRGACAMCGTTELPPRRRSWCSDACVGLWNLATFPLVQRRQLEYFHGPGCWGCGREWEPGQIPYAQRLGQVVGARDSPFCRIPELGPPEPRPVVLEVEHVRPLWSLTDEERLELKWWLPFNLQLLCTRCHKAKSKREAAERAALRRGERWSPRPVVEQLALV